MTLNPIDRINFMLRLADADGNGYVENNPKEMALFTYNSFAKEIFDMFERDEDSSFVGQKVQEFEEKHKNNLNDVQATAALMYELDKNQNGKVENDEMGRIEENQNIDNLRDVFDADNGGFENVEFNFDKFLKYTELVNTNNDAEVSQGESVAFGELIKSQMEDNSAVKNFIMGEELTAEEQTVVNNLQAASANDMPTVTTNDTPSAGETPSSGNEDEEPQVGTRQVMTTNEPPVIDGNTVKFGNGKTIEIPSGTTAKLSDDGMNVLFTTKSQAEKASITRNKNGVKTQYYTQLTTIVKYDKNGNAVEETVQKAKPKINSTTKQVDYVNDKDDIISREFDEYGNCIKETTKELTNKTAKNPKSRKTTVKNVKEFSYDEENRIVEQKTYGTKSTPKETIQYEYSACGKDVQKTTLTYKEGTTDVTSKVVEETSKDDDGKIVRETVRKYDKNDKLTSSVRNAKCNSITEYVYDEAGKVIEKKMLYYDKTTGEEKEYGFEKYDSDGKVTDYKKGYKSRINGVTKWEGSNGKYITSTNNKVFTNQDGVVTDLSNGDVSSWVDINLYKCDGSIIIESTKDFGTWGNCHIHYGLEFPAGSKITVKSYNSNGATLIVTKPDGSTQTVKTSKITNILPY